MQTRREFLLNTAAVALTACLSRPLRALAGARPAKRRYVVLTPTAYWEKPQDLSRFAIDKTIPRRFVARRVGYDQHGRRGTMMTIVDDDGANVRRVMFPGIYHSAISGAGLIYPIGAIAALDSASLELVACPEAASLPGDDRRFSGHAVRVPGTDAIAFGMNHYEHGKHDLISIRDARTLKELQVFPSYGFELHEIRLTRDAKYFVCGHYGSYLGNGIYKDLIVYGGYDFITKKITPPDYIYPGSVTLVDVKSGKRSRLLSDVEAGQEGHADSDERYDVYLGNKRALLKSRPGLEKNPRFREGVQTEPDRGEFANKAVGRGICVAYDPVHREVIVPKRAVLSVEITNVDTQEVREIDFSPELAWGRPTDYYTHGLEFHPDGKHYILSTTDGFVAVERGTHRINPDMTFRLPLLIHTHLHIL